MCFSPTDSSLGCSSHSSVSTFACVQGKELEEVKEATVSGPSKSDASSNSY